MRMQKPRINNREAEIDSSEMLIEELMNGKFLVDRLPNSAEDFTGTLEYNDFIHYLKLVDTRFFDSIMNVQKNEYAAKYYQRAGQDIDGI